jgi:hypothetical protein
MKLRKLVAVCSLAVFLLFPPSSLACACCTEPGQYFLGEQELNEYRMGILQEVRFLTADLFGPEPYGISLDKLGEDNIEFVTSGLLERKTWNFSFKSLNGEAGSLILSMPVNLTEYMADTHDESIKATPHIGPVLYKELRFKSKVKNATGFFQEGIDNDTEYFLVLQGRGHSCANAEDYTHWRLEVSGENADYAFWGRLESSMQTYRVTGVQKKDVLNIRPNPRDADLKSIKGIRGKIPADGMGIFVIGDAIQFNRSYWVPIVWKNTRGWVNRKYIVREKPKGV